MLALLSKVGIDLREYVPKTVTCWQEGYSKEYFFNDLIAGITVGIISLPLALAFALGSGVLPERGIYTAIIAGFLISLLGGSRVQIGGPTGAFIAVIAPIVSAHGYEGLAIATLMAGAMIVLMGIARFGFFLKFIPYPVTTGLTVGISLVIFSNQIKDFLGLNIASVPNAFTEKWTAYFQHASTWNPWAFATAFCTLILIFVLRKVYPKVPGSIIAVALAALIVYLFDLPVDTLEKKFGALPRSLPKPALPNSTWEIVIAMFPSAISIALLGAIESLLSAVIADGMTGHKHRSNCELVAQGLANIGSVLFGGIPATGAIARTGANIKMGAKTPLAGLLHAATLFLFMMFLAPLAGKVPLCALGALLIFVAWNMCEFEHFISILKGPFSDVIVLLTTFFLTVLVDISNAVVVGVLIAAVMFLKRMTDSTACKLCKLILEDEAKYLPESQDSDLIFRKDVPEQVAIFEIIGPFFFGIAESLNDQLRSMPSKPAIFILRMRKTTLIDAAGIHALRDFQHRCERKGIRFLISGANDEIMRSLRTSGIVDEIGFQHFFPHLNEALVYSRKQLKAEAS